MDIMEDNTIKAASSHVRAIAALCLRQSKGHDLFLAEDWFRMVPKCAHQPSVLGFIVKNIMISHLAKCGFILDSRNSGRMRILQLGTEYTTLIDRDLALNQASVYIPIRGTTRPLMR